MQRVLAAALGAAACLLAARAEARDPFSLVLTVEGQTGSASYTRIEDAINSLESSNLALITPNYTETAAAVASFNLRGVAATGIYERNSTFLRVVVPGAGIDQTFRGATRDESQQLFLDWLQGQGGSDVTRFFQYAVASTPIDPVAGNPNALMSQMPTSDFNAAIGAALGDPQGFQIGARFGSFSAGGYSVSSIKLPVSYTWQLTEESQLQVEAPIAWSDTGGAYSYSGNVGVMYRHRLFDGIWTLQPALRIGGVGSTDLGGGAAVWSAGLTSVLNFELPEQFRLTIGNSATYISTAPLSFGDFRLDYDVQNTVWRNGILLTRDLGVQVGGLPLQASVFAVDTRFTGDAVYVRNYQEYGVYLQGGYQRPVRIGVTYMTGDRGVNGLYVNTGITF